MDRCKLTGLAIRFYGAGDAPAAAGTGAGSGSGSGSGGGGGGGHSHWRPHGACPGRCLLCCCSCAGGAQLARTADAGPERDRSGAAVSGKADSGKALTAAMHWHRAGRWSRVPCSLSGRRLHRTCRAARCALGEERDGEDRDGVPGRGVRCSPPRCQRVRARGAPAACSSFACAGRSLQETRPQTVLLGSNNIYAETGMSKAQPVRPVRAPRSRVPPALRPLRAGALARSADCAQGA